MNLYLKKSIDEFDVDKAVIIGRNIVNTIPNDIESVDYYLCFLLKLADNLTVLEERRDFLEQAQTIVLYISENMQLNDENLDWVMKLRTRINAISIELEEKENIETNNIVNEIKLANSKVMIEIHNVIDELKDVKNQTSFDVCMKKFVELDRKIDKDYFDNEIQLQYDQLSKMCSDVVSDKIQEIEHLNNIKYNNAAVSSFSEAYKDFCLQESRYKGDVALLICMLNRKVFCFDLNRLFAETLVYYQDIYRHIFEKLSDDGKEKLTSL